MRHVRIPSNDDRCVSGRTAETISDNYTCRPSQTNRTLGSLFRHMWAYIIHAKEGNVQQTCARHGVTDATFLLMKVFRTDCHRLPSPEDMTPHHNLCGCGASRMGTQQLRVPVVCEATGRTFVKTPCKLWSVHETKRQLSNAKHHVITSVMWFTKTCCWD